MSRKILLVRVDAGPLVGMGHLCRVGHLLTALGSDFHPRVVGDGEVLANHFEDVWQGAGSVARRLGDALASSDIAGILYDPPALSPEECEVLKHADVPVVLVDDYGGPFPADVVINGTVIDDYHCYPTLKPGAELLCGPAYALLAPAFARNPWAPSRQGLLSIVVGGGEPGVRWADWLVDSGVLSGLPFREIRLVVGSAFPQAEKLADRAAKVGVSVRQGLSSDELAMQLTVSDVLLATGGMIAYEAMAIGVPTVLFPQMTNLVRETAWFAQQGAAIDLGATGGFDAGKVRESLERLAVRKIEVAAMSHRARSLIDGLGVGRAATVVRRRFMGGGNS